MSVLVYGLEHVPADAVFVAHGLPMTDAQVEIAMRTRLVIEAVHEAGVVDSVIFLLVSRPTEPDGPAPAIFRTLIRHWRN